MYEFYSVSNSHPTKRSVVIPKRIQHRKTFRQKFGKGFIKSLNGSQAGFTAGEERETRRKLQNKSV